MRNIGVFLIFLSIRIFSIYFVQTFYVPDEYWQTLEVAHKLVYHYGYLTWEWTQGIRNYLPPLIIAFFYKLLYWIKLDTTETLVYGPRVIQAILSSYSDLCFYKWSGTRKWAIFSIGTSWFWFYTGSRTLINTLECSLTTIGLSKFPWPGKRIEESSLFIWIAAIVFFIRPTSGIIWLPIGLYHLKITKHTLFHVVITQYIPIGIVTLILTVLLDSGCHGSLLITPYKFIQFNVFQNLSSFYGVQPWHWYLSSGIPSVLGIFLLPFLLATVIVLKNIRIHPIEVVLLSTIAFTVFVYSLLPHKEFRFILPLFPMIFYMTSRFLSAWSRKSTNFSVWLVAIVIFIGNLVPAWYFGMVHQRGTLDVMNPLREISEKNPDDTHLLFLMPCHSTPLYSHLHINVTTRFLTCLPNLNNQENYTDEADLFYLDPNGWFRNNYPQNGTLPTHIISFDILQPFITDILNNYKLTHEIWHTNIPLSSRIGKYVLIHRRIDL
ncbi:GPI mannosyltransferase 3 [Diorhabda carinulata]|uniref:GPI mannosyltransferase 3 n=1 Tax=Diorhabda carinulata TaxID=1163345 RepID=UPI0025A2A6C2|nr:GPI mannosyltransferase 3 [Diorhabda carinulata]